MDSTLSAVCAATSTPAENALPSPLSTRTDTSERASISPSACANSSIIGMSMTFRGTFRRTTRATGAPISTVRRASLDSTAVPILILSVPPYQERFALQINRRLPHFPDARQRIAGAGFLGNPLLLGLDNVEQ